jgi:subtilase family protein/thrombospondin type 3 repeat protein/fervidolysin-like protein
MRRPAAIAACGLALLAAPAVARAGEIVVVREPGVSAAHVRGGAAHVKSFPGLRAEVLRVPAAQRDATLARLNRLPGVRFAEPNVLLHTMGPDLSAQQWAPGQVRAPSAWATTTGGGSIVAVVDTGVNSGHEDLQGRIAPGGHDFIDGDNDPEDQNGHGTHVATAIVGDRDSQGINGIAPSSSALIVRALNAGGFGDSATIAAAFDYAAKRARIVSASLGGPEFSEVLNASIADNPNTLFVVAAGNAGSDNDVAPTYPCNAPALNLICVGATDQSDEPAGFSNVGRRSVDVFAPGVGIIAGWIGGPSAFDTISGTSMATPIVSGIAALVLSRSPSMPTLALKNAVLGGAVRLSDLVPLSVTGARADALRAIFMKPADTDTDGIGDAWDDCRFAADPQQVDSDVDGAGDACDDDDGDGVPFSRDACPETSAPHSTDGCPGTIDTDGDHIFDVDDSCPAVAGIVQFNGCPDTRDRDQDGRVDSQDACPRQGAATDTGCPQPRIRSVRARKARCGGHPCLKVRIVLAKTAQIELTAQRCHRRDGRCEWRTLATKTRRARVCSVTFKQNVRRGRYRVRAVARNAEGTTHRRSRGIEIP